MTCWMSWSASRGGEQVAGAWLERVARRAAGWIGSFRWATYHSPEGCEHGDARADCDRRCGTAAGIGL